MKLLAPLKRTLCATVVIVIAITGLVSCSGTKDVVYYEENGKSASSMNENMFSYHLSENKTFYLYGLGVTSDVPELWEKESTTEGKTVGDMAFESITDKAREIVAASYMFDETKKSSPQAQEILSEAEISIEKKVDALVAQLTTAQGSKSGLENYLSQFGTDIDNLRKYYTMYFKMSALQSSFAPTEEEKKNYFENNYSIVKHILINTSFKVKDDGSKVSLSEEEKNARLLRAKDLEARLSAGEDFDVLWALPEYQDSDAAGAAMYPEGYFVCGNSKFTPEFEKAALDMKDGEIRTVTSTYGIHIMKKYPMDSSKYNLYPDVLSDIEGKVAGGLFDLALSQYLPNVKVDSSAISEYSVVTAPVMQ